MSTPNDWQPTRSLPRLIGRGFALRCPRCGQGGLFRRWTEMVEYCPRCGLVFEQEEGYWVGALTIATVAALLVSIVGIVVVTILTWPDLPIVPLIAIGVVGMVLFPILFYPFSKTLWVAIDLYFFNPWRMQPGTGLRRTR